MSPPRHSHPLAAPLLVLGLLLATGCATPAAVAPAPISIKGTATYRERMALPPNAELTVRLHPAPPASGDTVLAEQRLTTDGRQVPLPFQLEFLPTAADSGYVLTAEIRALDQLLFATVDPVAIDPAADTAVEIRLIHVPAAAPDLLWEQAAQRGVTFRGVGNEPGWALEIQPGKQMLLETDYGQRRVATPVPRPTVNAEGWTVYRAVTEAHELEVRFREQPCEDSMSGESFPFQVSVVLDGGELQGCGRRLLP